MNNDMKVNLIELNNAANELKRQSSQILSTFSTKILPIIESSKQYFMVSGIDYSTITSSFTRIYSKLNSRSEALSDLITNKVIPQYTELSSNINKMFNNEFVSEIQQLLPDVKTIEGQK